MKLHFPFSCKTLEVRGDVAICFIAAGLATEVLARAEIQAPARAEWHPTRGRTKSGELFIGVSCNRCHHSALIQRPTENASFQHCGIVEKVPANVLAEYRRLKAAESDAVDTAEEQTAARTDEVAGLVKYL